MRQTHYEVNSEGVAIIPGMPSAHRHPDLTDPSTGLGELIVGAARQLRMRTIAAYEPWGLAPHHARALRVIGTHGPVRLGWLAERLRVAPRSATDVVDALESRGLVARAADPDDRRAVVVEATPDGRHLLEEVGAVREEAHTAYLSRLSERERAALTRLLRRLVSDDGQ